MGEDRFPQEQKSFLRAFTSREQLCFLDICLNLAEDMKVVFKGVCLNWHFASVASPV